MEASNALVRFLVRAGVLDKEPESGSINYANERPIQALSRRGMIGERAAIDAMQEQLGIDYIDLESPSLLQRLTPDRFKETINSSICWRHRIAPLFDDGEAIHAAIANPFEQEGIKALEFALSKPIKTFIAQESKIVALLKKFFPQQIVDDKMLLEDAPNLEIDQESQDLDHIDPEAAPIVKIVNKILSEAIAVDASDIHMEPHERKMSVRIRVDGALQDMTEIPAAMQRAVIARVKILSGMDIAERRRPQDGRLRVKISGKDVDMRVSSIPVATGEKVVLRLFGTDYESLTFERLGMPADIRAPLQRCLQNRGKLVLVTGPTGSGKTTTLYAALNYLRDGKSNITTIEDPIEHRFSHLNQIQINKAVDVNFAAVLRAVLRQDPDIVMIGEIRDQETLSIVLQAAQTGHMVLSTVHTNDAISALFRLLDLGAEPFRIATALSGVLAQRLVRLVCKECSRSLSDEELQRHKDILRSYNLEKAALRTGAGCAACFNTGYRGRAGLYSFFEVKDRITELIHASASYEVYLKEARADGFTSLEQAAVDLLAEGQTDCDELLPYLHGKAEKREDHLNGGAAVDVGTAQTDPTNPTGLSKPRVLIIDDNKTVRRMVAALLKREMVEVQEAANGLSALEEVYRCPPDLVICDLRMPEMDGREFLRRMQKNERTRGIPFIVLTVDGTADNEIEFLESGACEFLSKDTSPLILMTRIRRILDSVRR